MLHQLLPLRQPQAQEDSPLDPDPHHLYHKSSQISSGQHRYVPDFQFTAKDRTRHLASPMGWDRQHLKHPLRYLNGKMRYKLVVSRRLPQGHSRPLRQCIPLHINTYCDSDCRIDIDSRSQGSLPLAQSPLCFKYLRHSTAGRRVQLLPQVLKPNPTPSASASATAYASTNDFKNFNIIFSAPLLTSATSTPGVLRDLLD